MVEVDRSGVMKEESGWRAGSFCLGKQTPEQPTAPRQYKAVYKQYNGSRDQLSRIE